MERGEACGLQLGSGDQALTPQEYGVLNKVSDHLRNKASQWRDPPVLTVLDPIRSGFPCPASAGQAGR